MSSESFACMSMAIAGKAAFNASFDEVYANLGCFPSGSVTRACFEMEGSEITHHQRSIIRGPSNKGDLAPARPSVHESPRLVA